MALSSITSERRKMFKPSFGWERDDPGERWVDNTPAGCVGFPDPLQPASTVDIKNNYVTQ